MTHYRTNHATFEMPAQLKDKTMHMFTLSDNGPSEFCVVISHADAQAEDTLANFAERLLAELGKALPDFQLDDSGERAIDGTPAIELAYRWRNDSNFMHQRQVIVLLPGAGEGGRQAMMIAATCFQAFSTEWRAAFEGMLGSVKLRHNAPVGSDSATMAAPTVFALSDRRRTLQAFASAEEACRKVDAREVEQDAWTFYDAAGTPLHANFVVPNTGTLWRKAGSYTLEARPERGAPGLRERLHLATIFVAGSPTVRLSSIAEVQAMLGHVAEV
ncbi:DcrB-related protein [Massilia antarctica]|uniref:DcrB-related protein n=1 Tax=Massilia antarctica TaxID=2765360 RepID=A0AA48WC22_9BURK|nr:DcrB-related protein [Massilia antarctica]QPI48779.1 DcrB-related protein [Massilia antarctica]